jgi:transposase
MPHADFVHLRVNSAYSLSEGAIKLKELAALCRRHAMPAGSAIIGDKGYDANSLRGLLERRGTAAVIPSRSCRKVALPFDAETYKDGNVIKRMFCRLKDYRRIATRYDKLAQNFPAALCLAAVLCYWIN